MVSHKSVKISNRDTMLLLYIVHTSMSELRNTIVSIIHTCIVHGYWILGLSFTFLTPGPGLGKIYCQYYAD